MNSANAHAQQESIPKWWQRPSILLLGSLCLTIGLVEAFFFATETQEITDFFTPFEHSDSEYARVETDDRTERTLTWYIPGATGVTGSVPVRINNLGLRDERDYTRDKRKGCLRVLAVGDSMTFGKGVAENDTFLAVTETLISRKYPDRCIEILNAAQPNTNFFQHYLQYRLRWHELLPDVVLFCFFPYNDTQVEGDEEPYSQSWMEFIDRNAWLKSLATVRWVYYRLFFDLGDSALADAMHRFFDDNYPGWIEFSESVPNLARFAQEHGSEVAFVLVPVPAGYDDYPYVQQHQKVSELTEQNGIPSYDLLRAVTGRGILASDHWVHPSDAHPDTALHRIYGEWLASALPWRTWMERSQ
jgi:hypothetical protein